MIKKITLALLLCFLVISCGKKGDPEYKEPEKKADSAVKVANKKRRNPVGRSVSDITV